MRMRGIQWFAFGAILAGAWSLPPALARPVETRGAHRLETSDAMPGAIGRRRLLQGEPLAHIPQPIVARVPSPAIVELAQEVPLEPPPIDKPTSKAAVQRRSELLVGILLGHAYRLRIRGISTLEETELYPTIELLDRLSPPVGKELDYPIPFEFTAEELRLAAEGNYVTKVIYVEDSDTPFPIASDAKRDLPYFEVLPHEDPLEVADLLGRPVAMLRIGAARPDESTDLRGFFHGFPPVEEYDPDQMKVARMLLGGSPSGGTLRALAIRHGLGASPIARRVAHEEFDIPTEIPAVQDPAEFGGVERFAPHGDGRPDGCGIDSPNAACETVIPCPSDQRRPVHDDEYVCDGGDRDVLARSDKQGSLSGVNSEDTVATFRTPSGQRRVVASSRACVYSPRFVAARKTVRLIVHEQTQLVLDVQEQRAAEQANSRDGEDAVIANQWVEGSNGTSISHAVQDRRPGRLVERVLRPEEGSNRDLPWQHRLATRTGMVRDMDRVALQIARHNAIEWSSAHAVQVIIDEESAPELRRLRGANEGVLYEAGNGARLQLIKTASRPDAAPGETISFSLQFKNCGPEPMDQLVIEDHLTHRLGYVENSQDCSRAAEFTNSATETGMLLRWSLGEVLGPGDDGVITFDCRMR